MNSPYKIRNLSQVLQNNVEIVSYETARLTAPGENYGSLILSVKILLKNGKVLETVAKLCPPNEWIKKMFNIPVAFKRELGFYQTIIPAMKNFIQHQRAEIEMDFFAKFFGGRINLQSNSNEVDDDAVLLFENLTFDQYKVMDRMEGFDLETTKIILKNLAIFHAIPLGFKILQLETFKEQILAYLPKGRGFDTLNPEIRKYIIDRIINVAEQFQECKPYLREILHSVDAWDNTPPLNEFYSTITHCDLWVNNIMVKTVKGETISSKFVDLQSIEYGSPASDLIFFLFSSVKIDIFNDNFEQLVEFYHNQFVNTLSALGCNVSNFTLDSFRNEMKSEGLAQFYHVLTMLKPLYTLKGTVKDISEIKEEDVMKSDSIVSPLYPNKVKEVILGFAKYGLISV